MGRLGELSPAASVAVGILVGLISTSVQSVGLTLQRKSHLLEDSKEDDTHHRPPYRRRRWQLGMSMFIISNLVGSTIQITTLPLPVLSTLQASGLVFNTICATLILGEPFTRWSLGGTGLVAGGAVLIALFGALPEPSHTLDQLLALLSRPQFLAWMFCTGAAMIGILVLALLLPRLYSRSHGHTNHQRHLPHTHRLTPRLRLTLGLCYGCISAILSAHSLLIAKSAVELLVQTLAYRNNQFNRWQSWIILLALLFFALSQLYFLHRGLKIVSTSVLYPFVFCIYNVIAILDGLIYFHQIDRLTPLHAGLIALGTVILLAGVLALSWRLGDESHTESLPGHGHGHYPATPIAHENLLTPGMGMIEDTTTESPTPTSSSYGTSPSAYASEDESHDSHEDEESILSSNGKPQTANTENTPLLPKPKPKSNSHSHSRRKPKPHPHHYYDNTNTNFSATHSGITAQADEIWNALMDISDKEALERHAWTLRRGRRASTMTALHGPRQRQDLDASDDVCENGGNGDGDGDGEGDHREPRGPRREPRRTRTVAVADGRWRRSQAQVRDQGRSVSSPMLGDGAGLQRTATGARTLPRTRQRSRPLGGGEGNRARTGSLGAWFGGLFRRGRGAGDGGIGGDERAGAGGGDDARGAEG